MPMNKCNTCIHYNTGDGWISPYCTKHNPEDRNVDIDECCIHNREYNDLYEEGQPQAIRYNKSAVLGQLKEVIELLEACPPENEIDRLGLMSRLIALKDEFI